MGCFHIYNERPWLYRPLSSFTDIGWSAAYRPKFWFYKYFSEKITRFLCFGLIFISVCYCYQNDSEWPYAQLLIDHHRNNYTKEWYCKLTYRDKLLIEAYTTHGIEDCRQ